MSNNSTSLTTLSSCDRVNKEERFKRARHFILMSSIDFTKLVHHQSQLPHSIKVKIGKSKDGGFWVEILSLIGCFTQAESGEELFVMVNDAVYTYFDIPAEYFPFLPRYFPSEKIKKQIQNWNKSVSAKFPQQPVTLLFTQGVSR